MLTLYELLIKVDGGNIDIQVPKILGELSRFNLSSLGRMNDFSVLNLNKDPNPKLFIALISGNIFFFNFINRTQVVYNIIL